MKSKKEREEFWLYHPALYNPERGMTGRYRPAGIDPITKIPQIEVEMRLFNVVNYDKKTKRKEKNEKKKRKKEEK